ncbi:hypothetical protein BH09ACT5_BH09ACT5_16750 [soil metagenome]
MSEIRRRRRWPWIVGAILLVVLVPVAIIVVPIVTHQSQGLSYQEDAAEQWPTSVTATGDDGRMRELMVVAPEPGGELDTSALEPGDRLVVSGSGYDGSRGIYVAICVVPDDPATKPGPCIGGVPDQQQETVDAGTVQFAPSNWINDDWAWKLFGARSYDDVASGTFTAYIEVGDPVGDGFDCTAQKCGLFTRNDHTALADRVQDLYIPVAFAR